MSGAGVYQICHTATGKLYVGSAVNLNRRWANHHSDLRRGKHRNVHLQRAWELYGEAAFVFSVLEHVSDAEGLIAREQHYLDTLAPTYNFAPTAGSCLGIKHTEAARQRMSAANKGKTLSEEHRRKIGQANTGKSLSEDARQRLSEAKTAQWADPAWRVKATGEQASQAKLSLQSVTEIKALLADAALSQRDIAALYGVHEVTVCDIKTGRTWAEALGRVAGL